MPESTVSTHHLREAIRMLPEDKPRFDPNEWYRTKKEHWLGWLDEYAGPGAYGRKGWNYDAEFAYNHVVNPGLLTYLAKAARVPSKALRAALA